MPHVLETSDAVLQHLHPIDEMRGFTSEIFLNEVGHEHLRPVRNLLTAGSSLRVVLRDKHRHATRYYVHARPLHDARPHPRARAGDGRHAGAPDRIAMGWALDAASRRSPIDRGERLLANGHGHTTRP